MIFAKTNRGRLAAFDPQSPLPAAQKTLLRLIDGKTRLTSLNTTLPPSACSLELIEALLDQDLIQLTKTDAGHASPSANDDSEQQSQSNRLALLSSQNAPTAPASLMALLEQEWAPAGAGAGHSADFRHSSDYQGRLQSAKDSLISFVVTHIPAQAPALSQEIDQITHNEQLKATIIAVLSMAYQACKANPDQASELYKTVQQLAED